jgi:hypothetical protein
MTLAGHGVQPSTADLVGRWLQESWAQPNPAKRTAPPRVIDPLPVLTPQVLAQLASVWQRFRLSEEQRIPYMRETVVPVVTERPLTAMMDMSAVAAKVPAVAAVLKQAGLTAEQFDAARLALLSARLTWGATEGSYAARVPAGTVVDPASVLGRNVAFVKAHLEEVKAIDGMFLDGS